MEQVAKISCSNNEKEGEKKLPPGGFFPEKRHSISGAYMAIWMYG